MAEWENVSGPTVSEGGWENVPSEIPTDYNDEPKGEMKPIKGFERLRSPIELIKEESIPAHLINWLTTPESTYRKKERIEKDEFIKSIPILDSMNERLDEIEWISGQDGYTKDLEDEHNKLIDAYGTMYQKMEKAYDAGELESGFSWEGFKEAVSEDPSGMLAEVANTFMADPELLLTPIGWEYAAAKAGVAAKGIGASNKVQEISKVTAGVGGSAALGGGIAAADNLSRQLSEKGKVNPDEVVTSAKIGAIAAPILIGGFKAAKWGTKELGAANFNRQFKKSIGKIEVKAQEFKAKGLADDEQAVKRAINESYIPNKVRKELAKRHDWIRDINLSDDAIKVKYDKITKDADSIKGKMYSGLSKAHKFTQDVFGNLSTEIGLIHSNLRHTIKRLDMDTAIAMKHGLDVKDSLKKVYDGLDDSTKIDFNIALGNGNKGIVRELIGKSNASPEAKANIENKIYDYFTDVYNRSEVAGMGLKKLDNYFPMEVKDYAKYARYMGFEARYIDEVLSNTINSKFKLSGPNKVKSHVTMKEASKYLNRDEISEALNKALSTPYKGGGRTTTHMKSRVIGEYNRENIDFYRDPIESFANYVTSIEPRIMETMFFGGKKGSTVPHSGFISNSIGGMVKRLFDNGEIIADDIPRLEELLTARFVEGTRAPHKAISGLKNILYSATLGNPLSAMTQLGDVGNSAYITGVMETVRTVPLVIGRKVSLTMEDFGLNNIVQEFEHLGTTAKILDKSLGWSGFKAIDRLGKETVINASLHKFGKMAKTKKGRNKLIDKYKDAYTPEQMSNLLNDLKIGRTTPDVKYMLWHELTRIQPVSLSEMPVSYLRHPNARIFYMLKTFTLKQLDLVRREAYQKIRGGDPVTGLSNLAKWTGILGLSNATVEQSKAWIRGEDVEFEDMVIAQMYRNYGLSKYVLDQIGRGDPLVAMTTLAMPPVGIFDDAVKDLMNFGESFNSLKHVPPYGKGLYYLLDMENK